MHILSLPAAAVRCKVPEKSSSEYQGLIFSRLGTYFLLTGSNFCTFTLEVVVSSIQHNNFH